MTGLVIAVLLFAGRSRELIGRSALFPPKAVPVWPLSYGQQKLLGNPPEARNRQLPGAAAGGTQPGSDWSPGKLSDNPVQPEFNRRVRSSPADAFSVARRAR